MELVLNKIVILSIGLAACEECIYTMHHQNNYFPNEIANNVQRVSFLLAIETVLSSSVVCLERFLPALPICVLTAKGHQLPNH